MLHLYLNPPVKTKTTVIELKKMIRKIMLLGVGNGGTAVINIFATIYFTKNLGGDEFAEFVLYQTLINFLYCLIGYNLSAGVLKKSLQTEFASYIRAVILINMGLAVILLAVGNAVSEKILTEWKLNFSPEKLIFAALMLSLFQLSFSILQSKQEFKKYFIVRNAYAAAILVAFFLIGEKYIKEWDLYYMVQAILMGGVFIFVALKFIGRIRGEEVNELKKEVIYSLSYGIKLMPYTISGWAVVNLDKIFLNANSGNKDDITTLALSQSVFSIASFLFVAINGAWAPRFFQIISKSDDENLKKARWKYTATIAAIVIILFIGGVLIENVYINKGYEGYMVVMMIVGLTRYVDGDSLYFANYLYYYEKVLEISKAAVAGAVVYMVLLYALGSIFGLYGILVASLAHAIIINIYYRKKAKEKSCGV